MEIYQLRTFLAVARLGHLTKAAEQLHISQPAVSKQIRALEEELGLALFERTPAGMTLTRSGASLVPHAEKTLEHALGLVHTARLLRGEVGGLVKLGTIIDPESLRLGEFLGRVLQDHPMIEVKLHHGISGGIMERVLAGELDAGFYLGPVTDPRLDHIELKQVRYKVIAPPAWAARVEAASWPELAALPWVGTPPHSSQHRIVKEMFAERGLVPNFTVEADQEASMLSLVRSGAALCIMREELAEPAAQRGEVHILAQPLRLCMLSFLFLKMRHADAALAAVGQALRRVWGLQEWSG